jgi:glycine cleavage system regulatory protein
VLLVALQKISGLNVVIQPTQSAVAVTSGRQTKLEIVGSDRPGIVREIASALARASVNVEEFFSELVSAPMSGETLFKASARLQLPANCDLAALKRDLEKIAADLLVDVSFAELSGK